MSPFQKTRKGVLLLDSRIPEPQKLDFFQLKEEQNGNPNSMDQDPGIKTELSFIGIAHDWLAMKSF